MKKVLIQILIIFLIFSIQTALSQNKKGSEINELKEQIKSLEEKIVILKPKYQQ